MFGVLGLCWMWHGAPFARQRRPIIGVLMSPPPPSVIPPAVPHEQCAAALWGREAVWRLGEREGGQEWGGGTWTALMVVTWW